MKRIAFALLISLTLLLSQGCRRSYGYGVVLWSPDEVTVSTGSVVKVRSKIQRKEVYRIDVEGRKEQAFEIKTWRIQFFRSKKAASEYARKYAFYTRSYVEGERAGLPLRAAPSTSSAISYKIAEGQTLKVLSRSKDRVQIGSDKGYWYELLTPDGVQGWTFGRYLREFVLSDNGTALYDEKSYMGDAILENFFNNTITWRPRYYLDMIMNEQINLDYFKTEYGLFIDPNMKSIAITLPQVKAQYTYTSIAPVGGSNYHFNNSEFSFSVGEKETIARFSTEGRKFKETFVPIKGDLGQYISEELSRRAAKYRKFVDMGGAFLSDWGMLTFSGDNNFSLTNGSRFIENAYLSSYDGSMGEVKFDVFLVDELAKKYDGAFSLVFNNSGTRLTFVYSLTSNGFVTRLVDRLPANKTLGSELMLGAGPEIVFKN